MTSTMPTTRSYDPVSVSPLSFWAATAEERERSFRILRDERPVSWHPPLEGALMPPQQEGVWAVVRHEDIVRVSKDYETFSSAHGVMQEEVPEDILDAAQSFLGMDPPRHTRLRRLISSAFTPRQVAKIEEQIRGQAKRIVDELIEAGDCDFVAQVSKRLPMWTIYEMMGLPEQYREAAAEGADGMVSWADEDVAAGREPGQVLNDALISLLTIGMDLAEMRRAKPTEDLMTNLVQAEVDGQRLTDEEIGAFFVLLSVAGNDTTRNTISLTTKALCEFPDQRALLLENFEGRIGTAIEEFARWVTPVMTFRRTVMRDVELGGQQLSEGEWVVMFYSSGNRDERVFSEPERFDITRSPNPHVAFGGGGPHYCMGNMLAKTQLRALFDQLLHRVPELQVSDPTYLVGNFVRGVKSMPCTLR
ncbi:cytochrome P450 [Amycolatopsis sp. K13G38]|uniref:Cytochrome P450 n=1 Tax=Amycolatopsis acididurans TaxID=2724524 RepID=A0ABX1J5L3_9PSEU|nr:cytochrome P450 [Amycolatopsis acididurans]NKQ54219.1 cytochrome P450 [Amycolatopsis acididurans]